jgi:hypothetical protein
MTAANYILATAALFTLGAVFQLVRAARGWPVSVNGKEVPIWVSWVASVVLAVLALGGFAIFRG